MGLDNFKPTLWEGALLTNFHLNSVADTITTKPAKVTGTTAVFNRVGEANIKKYDGKVDWDSISTAPMKLTFDQQSYFAITLDDIDNVQSAGDAMLPTVAEHTAGMVEEIDEYILKTAIAKAKHKLGTVSNPLIADKTTMYDYIVDLGTMLSKAKVPTQNRYCIVSADVLGLLSKDDRFTRNPVILANGVVSNAKINGMTVIQCEEVGENKVVALHKSAVGYGKQIDSIEAMRLQSAFADGVRGLVSYGATVLKEEGVAVLHYKINGEGTTETK